MCIFIFQQNIQKVVEENFLDCSEVKLKQLYVPGKPKRLLIVGFPKSGAIWLKETLDNLFPYYYSLVSQVGCPPQLPNF